MSAPTTTLTRFPPAQLAVIALAAQGLSNLEIAERTGLTLHVAKKLLAQASDATGAGSRSGLVGLACRWGQLQDLPVQNPGPVEVTPGGVEVLAGMAAGMLNSEIARKARRSEHTIRSRCRAVHRALGARDRAHAVLIAWQLRILPEVTR